MNGSVILIHLKTHQTYHKHTREIHTYYIDKMSPTAKTRVK